jgi:hypothetical protein
MWFFTWSAMRISAWSAARLFVKGVRTHLDLGVPNLLKVWLMIQDGHVHLSLGPVILKKRVAEGKGGSTM